MVQFINEFTSYCQKVGLLSENEQFSQQGQDLSNILFMHLLTLNRLSLIQLANRITQLWIEQNQTNHEPLQEQSSNTNIRQNTNHLYDQYLQKEEKQIISQQILANQQLKDCTFQPQISKKSHYLEMNAPVHERLSKYGTDKRIKHQISVEIKAKNELKSCTFRPQVNQNASLNGDPFDRLYKDAQTQRAKPLPEEEHYSHQPKLISAPIHPSDYTSVPVEERLYNRYFDQMQQILTKQEQIQESEMKECTFTPQINSAQSSQNSRVFDRLYNHSQTKSISDVKDTQPTLMNRKSEKILKNGSQDQSQYVSQFQLDQSPFDRLYGEHKRIERKKKIKESLEIQKIPFRPQTNRR